MNVNEFTEFLVSVWKTSLTSCAHIYINVFGKASKQRSLRLS